MAVHWWRGVEKEGRDVVTVALFTAGASILLYAINNEGHYHQPNDAFIVTPPEGH